MQGSRQLLPVLAGGKQHVQVWRTPEAFRTPDHDPRNMVGRRYARPLQRRKACPTDCRIDRRRSYGILPVMVFSLDICRGSMWKSTFSLGGLLRGGIRRHVLTLSSAHA